MIYCVEVDRSGIGEEYMVAHYTVEKELTRDDVKQLIINEDCGYNDLDSINDYCEFDFYRVD